MIELTAGPARLAVDLERGGRFSSFMVDGRELILGPPDSTDRGIRWGCYVMAPWAGRIAGAVLDWNGRRHQLPRVLGLNAIHGLGYDRAWLAEQTADGDATLSFSLADAGWPFGGLVRHRIELGPSSLVAELTVTTEEPAPVTVGWHPWFLRGDGDARVRVEGAETLEVEALIPTGRREAVTAVTDLRNGPLLADRELDHVYPDVASPAVVNWPDLELMIEFAPPVRTLVVHTQPTTFCVEPQTGWPNAPALAARGVADTGLITVEPNVPFSAVMTWRWRTAVTRSGRSASVPE